MANYTQDTNFAAKDTLPSGVDAKKVKGTEIYDEFGRVATASATKVDKTGATMSGNLDLGDNVRLRFGTDNDLQLWHDASNSYISDTGTGELRIGGADAVRVMNADFTILLEIKTGQEQLTQEPLAFWDDIYAINGTINTSDATEKQSIEELTEAETRVAQACKGLIRKFKWNSAVEKKGSEARYHFGVIAQDLQAAFAVEGLDAGDYGLFVSSTWTDDNGVEQTKLGVRYTELLSFIIGGTF